MHDVAKIQELAEAAGHLCSALDELSAAGYESWSGELKHLMDIIAAEIAWLQMGAVSRVV